MRLPLRTTFELQAAPFSTTAPFSFRASSTNQGVLGPVPPLSSSSFVNAVRRRPAKANLPSSSTALSRAAGPWPVSYTHLRAHETRHDLVCRLLLEKKKIKNTEQSLSLN